ncbi:hypothetical protein pb186bvf_002025 [Paramecium bursaria]
MSIYLQPFKLCCLGCSSLCSECYLGFILYQLIGIKICCFEFKQCIDKQHCPECHIQCPHLASCGCPHFNLCKCPTCCSCIYDSYCSDICKFNFKCSNPCIIQDETPLSFRIIMEDYDYLGQEIMFDYGQMSILQHKDTQAIVAFKFIDVNTKQEAQELIKIWGPRLQIRFQSVIQLQQLFQRQIDTFLSKQYRTYFIYDYVMSSLKQEIKERRKKQQPFNETEICGIILGVLSGILYLQNNGINPSHINLKQIYINQEGFIKITYPEETKSAKDRYEEFSQTQQGRIKKYWNKIRKIKLKSYYYAPEQIQTIENKTDRLNSCIYSLAIIVLEIITQTSMKDCYSLNDDQNPINFQLINDRIQQASGLITINIMTLIGQMLHIDPENRITVQEAYQQIVQFQQTQNLIRQLPQILQDLYLSLANDVVINEAHLQSVDKAQPKSTHFQKILKQKNYNIGKNENNAFKKILADKNYKLGHRPRHQLDLQPIKIIQNQQEDSLINIYKEFQQTPLILYSEEPNIKDLKNQRRYVEETYKNGCTYKGEMLNDMRDGKGTYLHPNGSYYEGEWIKNQMNGKGKFIINDQIIYDGEWENDEYHGQGVETNPNPVYKDIDYHLIEIENYWISYNGEYFQDQKYGKGSLIFVDGSRYEGYFRKGKPDGKGKFTRDQMVVKGQWRDGKLL